MLTLKKSVKDALGYSSLLFRETGTSLDSNSKQCQYHCLEFGLDCYTDPDTDHWSRTYRWLAKQLYWNKIDGSFSM